MENEDFCNPLQAAPRYGHEGSPGQPVGGPTLSLSLSVNYPSGKSKHLNKLIVALARHRRRTKGVCAQGLACRAVHAGTAAWNDTRP